MRAEYSNQICGLEEFARLIKSANANHATKKLSIYGLIDEEISLGLQEEKIRETETIKVLLRANGVSQKTCSEGDKRKFQKNLFKQKLKLQLGL